ncbi:hypothetical protein CRG98_019316 [Punica granatum]|uniref:Uncharacterized protein n=1 Tax=Punica granatum TaxID=22663 RepID=A0A2I0JVE9_PUNGR|nr:hypothetical protein CRG98_019316 [Punica granatum]
MASIQIDASRVLLQAMRSCLWSLKKKKGQLATIRMSLKKKKKKDQLTNVRKVCRGIAVD